MRGLSDRYLPQRKLRSEFLLTGVEGEVDMRLYLGEQTRIVIETPSRKRMFSAVLDISNAAMYNASMYRRVRVR